jgi:positive regulator of sigma E activity
MSRAYNLVVPLFVLFACAWLSSAAFLQFSWATFCASVLHMSDIGILRIHVVSIWLFFVVCTAFLLLHIAVLLVPAWRRRLRPRAVSHLAVLASLYVIALCGAIVSKPKFQQLYRVFRTQRPNQTMQPTAGRSDVSH